MRKPFARQALERQLAAPRELGLLAAPLRRPRGCTAPRTDRPPSAGTAPLSCTAPPARALVATPGRIAAEAGEASASTVVSGAASRDSPATDTGHSPLTGEGSHADRNDEVSHVPSGSSLALIVDAPMMWARFRRMVRVLWQPSAPLQRGLWRSNWLSHGDGPSARVGGCGVPATSRRGRRHPYSPKAEAVVVGVLSGQLVRGHGLRRCLRGDLPLQWKRCRCELK